MIADLKTLFERDLLKLKSELELYADEALLWEIKPGIANSAGNLCLHLVGNLNHFVGAGLGQTGYIRNREQEFADKNVPRATLLDNIDQTIQMIKTTLDQLENPDTPYPNGFNGHNWSIQQALLHLYGHLSYHLGQINYHRRLIS